MDYRQQQRDPTRHLIGIATVVLVHAVVIYAMMTGLVRTAVDIVKKPLQATIVKEAPPPPPPPPPPPRRVEVQRPPPPTPFVPTPEVAPPAAVDTGAAIVIPTAPPPPKEAPPPPPPVVVAPPPPPPPPKPAVRRGVQRIAGEDPVYPRGAQRMGIDKGRVVARLMIDEHGNVTDVIIVTAEPPRHFDKAVVDALRDWKFRADGEKYVAEVEINFSLKD
jgi:protein TonB